MNPVIRADGNPKFAMISTLSGAILNIILDPIFIFRFHLGMMGAAIATVIGQMVTAGLALWYLFHMKLIGPELRDCRFSWNISRRTLVLGLWQLPFSSFAGCLDGGHQQYDPQIWCARLRFCAGAICTDSDGGGWNCYEIFSDYYFDCHWDGRGMYSNCRI